MKIMTIVTSADAVAGCYENGDSLKRYVVGNVGRAELERVLVTCAKSMQVFLANNVPRLVSSNSPRPVDLVVLERGTEAAGVWAMFITGLGIPFLAVTREDWCGYQGGLRVKPNKVDRHAMKFLHEHEDRFEEMELGELRLAVALCSWVRTVIESAALEAGSSPVAAMLQAQTRQVARV